MEGLCACECVYSMSAITAYNNDAYHRRYRIIQVELQQNQQRFSERGVATIGTYVP